MRSGAGNFATYDREAHASLPCDARGKILVGNRVHWHGDCTCEKASKKSREPLAGVFAPEENTVAFRNAARRKLLRENMRGAEQLRIRPPHHPVAAPPRYRNFAGRTRFGLEILEERLPRHGASSVAHSRANWE